MTYVPGSAGHITDGIIFDGNAVNDCVGGPTDYTVSTTRVNPGFAKTFTINQTFKTGSLGMYAGTIHLTSSTANQKLLQLSGVLTWQNGTIDSPSAAEIFSLASGSNGSMIGGNSTTDDSGDPSLGKNTTMYIAGVTGSLDSVWMGRFAAGHNMYMSTGAVVEVAPCGVFNVCQSHDNANSGGIIALGTITVVPKIQVDISGSDTVQGGLLQRELVTRSNGDNPSITALELSVQCIIYGDNNHSELSWGSMNVGDHLGVDIRTAGTGNFVNYGDIFLYGGSVLSTGNIIVQDTINGEKPSIRAEGKKWNSDNNVTIQSDGAFMTGLQVNINAGYIICAGWETNGAKFGQIKMDGSVNIGSATSTMALDGAYANAPGSKDRLYITGGVICNAPTGSTDIINQNFISNPPHDTWELIHVDGGVSNVADWPGQVGGPGVNQWNTGTPKISFTSTW